MPYTPLDPAQAAQIVSTLGAPLTNTGMILSDMRAELNLMLGGRPDTSPGELNRWLNFAYLDMASSLEIDELKANLTFLSVVANPLFMLPINVRAIRSVSLVDPTDTVNGGHDLALSTLSSYRRAAARSGTPREYLRDNRFLLLYPTPDIAKTMLLDFWIRPAKLVADTDSPIVPEEWHEAIIKSAASKGHSALREFETAGTMENEYVALVRRKEEPESMEDANRIVGSSVPRDRAELRRRFTRLREDDRDGIY